MKLAYISHEDINNINSWSGTPYFISKSLQQGGMIIHPIDKLKRQIPLSLKLTRLFKNWVGNKQNLRFHPTVLAGYAKQISLGLAKVRPDAILINDPILAADIETDVPIYIWADTLYAGMLALYPPPSSLSQDYVLSATHATKKALQKCRYAIFSSQWSANLATDIYGINSTKVHVVPFGANIDAPFSTENITAIINDRKPDPIKLIFIGREWERKGGDIVFEVAKKLHASGHRVLVNFIGCLPPSHIEIPDYIHCHGFISKKSEKNREIINRLLSESHFLFVPSRAEAYGIVFCEANSFALPCITSHIGGIPTIVKNNINGMTFSLDTPINTFCDYITDLMKDFTAYRTLALSSFNEYQQRLNWEVAAKEVIKLIRE